MRLPEGTPAVDGFLCSHPKCGRTWIRFALARYMSRALGLGVEVDLNTLWTVLPNFDATYPQPGRDIHSYAYYEDEAVPLIISTHLEFDPGLFGEAPVVFLVRSPYDIVVSNFFQRTKTQADYEGDMASFISDPEVGVPGVIDYWNGWAPRLAEMGDLTLSYEALRADARPGFAEICRRLGLPVDDGLIEDALEYSSMDNMRKLELERGIVNLTYDQSDPEALRVRRGKVGGFGDYLDAEQVEYIRGLCEERLSPAARELLGGYGLEPWLTPTG